MTKITGTRLSCILAPLLALPFLACGQSCEIDGDRIGDVRIGGSKEDTMAQLSSRYAVTELTQQGAAPTLVARRRGDGTESRPLVVVTFNDDRAFLIDSYELCATREGVGPGTTVGRAQQIYGLGRIDSTDLGYFVWFERKMGVMFLLEDQDIPTSLRGIPDDVLTPEHERQILSLGQAKIVAARVAGP
jgi:hypothetical protein